MSRGGAMAPFAINQDFRHAALVLRGFSRLASRPRNRRTLDSVPQLTPSWADDVPTEQDLWVLRARAPPCFVTAPLLCPPGEILQLVTSQAGLGPRPSFHWPVVRPHTVSDGACLLMVPDAC